MIQGVRLRREAGGGGAPLEGAVHLMEDEEKEKRGADYENAVFCGVAGRPGGGLCDFNGRKPGGQWSGDGDLSWRRNGCPGGEWHGVENDARGIHGKQFSG